MNSEQLEGAKKLFFILLGIDAVVTLIIGFNAFSAVTVLREVQYGARTIDQSMISSLEFWDNFSKLVFLTVIGVGIGLVKWLNACYSFARQTIGATGFKNEGWTAAGWIIPFFNLFKPYQIINEIYKAGSNGYHAPDDWKKESGSGALLAWWIFWAVTHFIGWMVTKQLIRTAFQDDITIPQAIGATELQAWFCVVSLVISGLWVWVANLLTQRLLDRKAVAANAQSAQYAYQTLVTAPIAATRPISPAAQAQPLTTQQQPALSTSAADGSTSMPSATDHCASFANTVDEDRIYVLIAEELEVGRPEKGLWTRLFAECEGNENRTKVLYIKQRAERLISAERLRLEQTAREHAAELERIERLRPPPVEAQQMEEHGITFDGERYTFGAYKYDKLSDAISYAKLQKSRSM